MKSKAAENFYAPFEQVLVETVIDCFEFLDDEDSYSTITNSIFSQMKYFIDKNFLKEVKNIIVDRNVKEISITCVIPVKTEGTYDLPSEAEKVFKMSWKNLSKEQVEQFKRKKEEIIKNGAIRSDCEIVG